MKRANPNLSNPRILMMNSNQNRSSKKALNDSANEKTQSSLWDQNPNSRQQFNHTVINQRGPYEFSPAPKSKFGHRKQSSQGGISVGLGSSGTSLKPASASRPQLQCDS